MLQIGGSFGHRARLLSHYSHFFSPIFAVARVDAIDGGALTATEWGSGEEKPAVQTSINPELMMHACNCARFDIVIVIY